MDRDPYAVSEEEVILMGIQKEEYFYKIEVLLSKKGILFHLRGRLFFKMACLFF